GTVRRHCAGKENGDGRKRSSPSPIPAFERSYFGVLFLSGVDLLEDFLVRRKPVCRLVRVDDIVVDRHFEDPAVPFLENRGESVLGLDGGLQTGGLGQVVSVSALLDLDVNTLLLAESDRH